MQKHDGKTDGRMGIHTHDRSDNSNFQKFGHVSSEKLHHTLSMFCSTMRHQRSAAHVSSMSATTCVINVLQPICHQCLQPHASATFRSTIRHHNKAEIFAHVYKQGSRVILEVFINRHKHVSEWKTIRQTRVEVQKQQDTVTCRSSKTTRTRHE